MTPHPLHRRQFIKTTAMGLAAAGLVSTGFTAEKSAANMPLSFQNLPQWKGFNFLDFFVPNPAHASAFTKEESFKWMRDWGFDFVRIPMAYPYYLDIDYSRDITPDEVYKISEEKVAQVDAIIAKAHKYGLHVSLNLHRAPGYCINAGFHEPYNLWKDQDALDAFCFHWEFWAKRYNGVSTNLISFDLVNEPNMRDDMNDQFSKSRALPPETYHRVAKAAVERIRSVAPDHLVIADGNSGGHVAVPELADLKIAQSCRGYWPFNISHYKAPWVYKDTSNLEEPTWPDGPDANREALKKFYQPWFDLKNSGVGVHCGECGGYNQTPHHVFLGWFEDVLSVLAAEGIGFGLWNMHGDFGILDSGRPDVDYEDWHGHKLDRKLLTMLQKI